jgi:metal-responsive CopG/Arc/MetJ family transcriptional regulator
MGVTDQTRKRRRVKMSITVDPDWIAQIDRFIAAHPEFDRSKVIDQALWTWYAKEQDRAMAEQYAAPISPEEQEEYDAWARIRDAAAIDLFSRREVVFEP